MRLLPAEGQKAECAAAVVRFGSSLAHSLAELGKQLLLELNSPVDAVAPPPACFA